MLDPKPPKYRDKRTQQFAEGKRIKEFQSFEKQANKRLTILEQATSKKDLWSLSSNKFHALGGDRTGQYGIWINEQWRICFEWPDGTAEPFNIEITDYH